MLKPRILVTGATGIWRREHAIAHAERGAVITDLRTQRA